MPESQLGKGALSMVLSAACFSLMGVCIQLCSPTLSNPMVVFFRNLAGLVVVTPLLLRARPWREQVATRHFRSHAVRGLAGLAAMYCFFYAIGHLPLADAVLLQYTLPLFIPVVEALWLHEPMSPRLAWPLVLGFSGVAIVLRPGAGLWSSAASVGLAAGAFSAVAQTGIRRLTKTEPSLRIIFYFALIGTLVSGLALPFSWVMPTPRLWAIIVVMGLCATAGQIFLTRAYAFAPASQVGGFVYAGVIVAAFLDWWRLGIAPRPSFLAGAVLIVSSGVLMFRLVATKPAVSSL